jgi:hypothetical protein
LCGRYAPDENPVQYLLRKYPKEGGGSYKPEAGGCDCLPTVYPAHTSHPVDP